jgi:hypothetical protein
MSISHFKLLKPSFLYLTEFPLLVSVDQTLMAKQIQTRIEIMNDYYNRTINISIVMNGQMHYNQASQFAFLGANIASVITAIIHNALISEYYFGNNFFHYLGAPVPEIDKDTIKKQVQPHFTCIQRKCRRLKWINLCQRAKAKRNQRIFKQQTSMDGNNILPVMIWDQILTRISTYDQIRRIAVALA